MDLDLPPIELVLEEKQLNYLFKVRNDQDSLRGRAYWHLKAWEEKFQDLCLKWMGRTTTTSEGEGKNMITTKENRSKRSEEIFRKKSCSSNTERRIQSRDSRCYDKRHNQYKDTSSIVDAKLIFEVRAGSIRAKYNNRMCDHNDPENLLCRWCEEQPETDEHIIDQCLILRDVRKWVPYSSYYKCHDQSETVKLATQAIYINECMESFEEEQKDTKTSAFSLKGKNPKEYTPDTFEKKYTYI